MKIFNTLTLLSAIIAIYAQMQSATVLFAITKPLTTILLISLVLTYGKLRSEKFPRVVFLALLACLLGDMFLLGDSYFIYGLSAFFVGHLLLTYAFTTLGGFRTQFLPLVVLLSIAAAHYAYLYPMLGPFKLPVAMYNLVIVLMAWQATCLALQRPSKQTFGLCFASLLFMFSDSMIAMNKFVVAFDWSSVVVLSTYWLSIAIIANVAVTPLLSSTDSKLTET